MRPPHAHAYVPTGIATLLRLAGLLTAAALPWLAVLIVLLAAPALLLWLVDHLPGKKVAKAALGCSAAALIEPIHALSLHGFEPGPAGLVSPSLVALAWAAPLGGMLLISAWPMKPLDAPPHRPHAPDTCLTAP